MPARADNRKADRVLSVHSCHRTPRGAKRQRTASFEGKAMIVSNISIEVVDCLRERGWDDVQIANMTPEEAFSEFCEWNGLLGYGGKLIRAPDGLRNAVP